MGRSVDIAGRRFGKLVATARSHQDKASNWYWHVTCDCGRSDKTVRAHDLLAGKQTACGCVAKPHGATSGGKIAPEWMSWRAMRQRCTDPKGTGYENYGGRGIKVCDRWLDSFENFLADMGPRPNPTDSIDRINNEGNYEPGNCRWATRTEQNQKKRGLVMLTVNGETTFLAEWARRSGIPEDALRVRVGKLGWTHERAVTQPPRDCKRSRAA